MKSFELESSLISDEGFQESVYQDSLGFWTIGFGRMVDHRLGGGITKEEALMLLRNDIQKAIKSLDNAYTWYREMPEPVQRVLVQMMFQLGPTKFSGFRRTLKAFKLKNFREAAEGMRDSLWYKQTPTRVERLAKIVEAS